MIPEDEKGKVVLFLRSKIKDFKCPICQERNFTFQEFYYADLAEDSLSLIGSNQQFSAMKKFSTVCNNCGNIQSFSTKAMGI